MFFENTQYFKKRNQKITEILENRKHILYNFRPLQSRRFISALVVIGFRKQTRPNVNRAPRRMRSFVIHF